MKNTWFHTHVCLAISWFAFDKINLVIFGFNNLLWKNQSFIIKNNSHQNTTYLCHVGNSLVDDRASESCSGHIRSHPCSNLIHCHLNRFGRVHTIFFNFYFKRLNEYVRCQTCVHNLWRHKICYKEVFRAFSMIINKQKILLKATFLFYGLSRMINPTDISSFVFHILWLNLNWNTVVKSVRIVGLSFMHCTQVRAVFTIN